MLLAKTDDETHGSGDAIGTPMSWGSVALLAFPLCLATVMALGLDRWGAAVGSPAAASALLPSPLANEVAHGAGLGTLVDLAHATPSQARIIAVAMVFAAFLLTFVAVALLPVRGFQLTNRQLAVVYAPILVGIVAAISMMGFSVAYATPDGVPLLGRLLPWFSFASDAQESYSYSLGAVRDACVGAQGAAAVACGQALQGVRALGPATAQFVDVARTVMAGYAALVLFPLVNVILGVGLGRRGARR